MDALSINLDPVIQLTDDQFYQICQVNPNLKFEHILLAQLYPITRRR
jgi:Uma2 family endonuclease